MLRKNRLQPIKDVALIQLGGTQEIIAGMQRNLVQGGSISLPLTLQARRLGFRELLTTESIALPFDYGCFIVKAAQASANAMSSKTSCARPSPPMIWRFRSRRWRRMRSPNTRAPPTTKLWTQPTKRTSKTMLFVSLTFRSRDSPRSSISAPRAARRSKKLALEKMFDNSLLREIQKEPALAR